MRRKKTPWMTLTALFVIANERSYGLPSTVSELSKDAINIDPGARH